MVANDDNNLTPVAEVTLSEAVTLTGISNRTLRRWVKEGVVQGRQVDSPFGAQWLVPLDAVREIVERKGLGHQRYMGSVVVMTGREDTTAMDDRGEVAGQEAQHDSFKGGMTTPVGQVLVRQEDWERALMQLENMADLAQELGEAKEAKGRAEAKLEVVLERLREERVRRRELEIRRRELEMPKQQWWRRKQPRRTRKNG